MQNFKKIFLEPSKRVAKASYTTFYFWLSCNFFGYKAHAEHTLNKIFTAKTLKLGLQLTKFHFFSPVPKSPIRTGLISVKNPLSNISCLGPFKNLCPKVYHNINKIFVLNDRWLWSAVHGTTVIQSRLSHCIN
jgi:hypothetical protein